MRCVCGHSREYHAWGTGACETVWPTWWCERGCERFMAEQEQCGRCGHAQEEHSWGVGECRERWLTDRCGKRCKHYVQRDA